ncbi:MAG: hypothetical protein HC897_07880 [Thermoanaerobaculia bacterium]|nr:hypothetical protein [Thermoanaerobaculia bacterium]
MPCTAKWSYKALNRKIEIKIVPKAGSNPTLIELGLRIIDLSEPPGPTATRAFSASDLANGVSEPLVPARRYELILVTVPTNTELVVTIKLDDGVSLVAGEICKRGQHPITGNWVLTTWRT